ncbi:MAG: PQQ-binding-like beta-propeller repeat protein, partial [Planctomycetota bacterium]
MKRDTDLANALTKMDQAISNGNTQAAYEARKALLHEHPTLHDDPQLAAKTLEVSQAERSVVRFEPESRAALTETPVSSVVATLVVAERRGAAAAGVNGVVPFRIDGAIYALSAADGALLWRRFVGHDPGVAPISLPGGRIIVPDAEAKELVCLRADSGELIWRQPLVDALSTPVFAGNVLYVAGASGKLFILDAGSGSLKGRVEFGQPIHVPPAVSVDSERIYVVGEHSNLYALSSKDYACLGVYYLGHAKGSVTVAPVSVLDKVIVAENYGAETCRVHAVDVNAEGDAVAEAAANRLDGLIVTPMLIAGRRVATLTTKGAINVYEVAPGDGAAALNQLAARDAARGQQLARYGLIK